MRILENFVGFKPMTNTLQTRTSLHQALRPSSHILTRRAALPATAFAVRHLSDSTKKTIEDVCSQLN